MNDTLRETCGVCGQPLVCAGSLGPKNKPDPHVVTEEPQADGDEILGAGISYASNIVNNGVRKQFMAFAQAIAAKIEDVRQGRKLYTLELEPRISQLEAKIEGVRKNHQEQIDKLGLEIESSDACFRREADSNLNSAVKALERKVEKIQNEQFKQREEILNRGDEIGALRTRVWGLEEKPKPQAKGGVALDKEGMPHDLIPGVSVLGHVDEGLIGPHHLFHHRDKEHIYHYPICGTAHIDKDLCSALANELVKLFDLPFPGGDK